jgi:hypothetical protein
VVIAPPGGIDHHHHHWTLHRCLSNTLDGQTHTQVAAFLLTENQERRKKKKGVDKVEYTTSTSRVVYIPFGVPFYLIFLAGHGERGGVWKKKVLGGGRVMGGACCLQERDPGRPCRCCCCCCCCCGNPIRKSPSLVSLCVGTVGERRASYNSQQQPKQNKTKHFSFSFKIFKEKE